MKKLTVNILCSTAVTLLLLAAVGKASGAQFLLIHSVFQSFLANVVIHAGLRLTHRIESSYALLGTLVDMGYIEAVVLIFGAIFHWYSSTPVWMLIAIAAIVYLAGILLDLIHIRQEIREINGLLRQRKEQEQRSDRCKGGAGWERSSVRRTSQKTTEENRS